MADNPVKVTHRETRYDIASLLANVERCQANIKTFEAAIQNERNQIGQLYDLIETERRRQVAGPAVHVDVVEG